MQKLRITRRGKILISVIALLFISSSVTAWQVCKYGSEEHGCSVDPRSWPGCIFGVLIDIGNCVMMFFISLMTEFILMNPDINEFKPFVNDIVSILFPIYVIAIIITGIYIIFLSTSPTSRARAKSMLIRLIMGMAMVTTSLSIYELLLNLSEAIAGRILSGWILGGGGGGLAIMTTLVVVSVILFFISAWILPMLVVIALISIAARFFLVSLMAVLFPLTLFLYFFEFTRSIGQKMMRYTLMAIFTQPVQALMLVIMIIGLNNMSTTGDILGKIVSLVMGIAGFLMLIFAPLLMLKLMSWVGGAVAGAGMMLAYKRPMVGALLVSAGGIGAGMGPEAMAAGGAVYTLGLAYQRKFPSRKRLDRTRRLVRKGWERTTGKVREKAPAVGAWLGRRRYIGRPLTIAHELGKKYVGQPIGKTYGVLKNVKRRAGHTVRVVRKHWKFIGKSLFIPGYWMYGSGKFMVRRTGISIRSGLRVYGLNRHIESIRRASTRSEVWNELRKSGADERGVRQRWNDWWKRREKFRERLEKAKRGRVRAKYHIKENKMRIKKIDDRIKRLEKKLPTLKKREDIIKIKKDIYNLRREREEYKRRLKRFKDMDKGYKDEIKKLREERSWKAKKKEIKGEIKKLREERSSEMKRMKMEWKERDEKFKDEIKKLREERSRLKKTKPGGWEGEDKKLREEIKKLREERSELKEANKEMWKRRKRFYDEEIEKRRGRLFRIEKSEGMEGREIRRLKERYPIEKKDADKLQDELYKEFKKLRGEKYMDTATARNRARDLVNRYIAENDFGVVEEGLREVGIDEKRITELGDRYDRRGLDRLKREAEDSIKFKRAIEHDLDSATTFEEVEEINEGLGDRGLPKEELERLKEREMERREKEVEKIEKEEAKDWARRKVAREGISSEDEAWAIEEMREEGVNPEKLSSKELNEEIRARVIEREAHHEAERIINEEMVVSDKFTRDVKNSLRANDAMERLKYARNPEEVKAIAREFGVSERDIHRIGAEYMTSEEGIEHKPSAIEKVKEKARKGERLLKAEKINREVDRARNPEEIEEAIKKMGLSRNDIDRMYAEDRNIPIHSARIKHDRNLNTLKESAKKAVRRKAMEKPVSIEEAKKMHERDLDTFKESAKKAIEERKHQIENKLGILDKIRRYGLHIGLALTMPGYVPYMAGRSLYGAMTTARSLIALQMINRLNYQDAERYKKLKKAMKRGGATEREARMLIGDERVVSKDDFEDLKKRASDFIIAKKFADRHYPGFTREFFKPFKPSSTIKKAIKRGKKYGVPKGKLARIEKYYEREMSRIEKKYAVPKGVKLSKERLRDLRKEKKLLIDRVNKQINNEIIESDGFSRHLRRVGDKYLLLDSEIRDIDDHFRISRAREISKLEKSEVKLRPEERIEKMNEINAKSLVNTHRSVAEIVGVEGYNEMTTEEHADYAKLGLASEGGEKGELLSEEEIKEESLKHSVDLGGNLHARMLLEDYMGIGPRPSEFYHGIGPETKEEREKERERKEVSPLYTAATTETETLAEAVIEGLDELRKPKEEKSE